jgi:hypothetical protein
VSKRLSLYVEGRTEELFVNRILRNHLRSFGVQVERPVLAITRPGPEERRGGFVNWEAVEADLRTLFVARSEPDLRFSTLLDLYALPENVPGYPGPPTGRRAGADVDAIEAAWAKHFDEPRFVPYLQRHEFEALVIAHPPALDAVAPAHVATLRTVIHPTANATSAEDVNDGRATHPSALLSRAIPDYKARKPDYALFTLLEAGLDRVRARCPRLNAWLEKWERWGRDSA